MKMRMRTLMKMLCLAMLFTVLCTLIACGTQDLPNPSGKAGDDRETFDSTQTELEVESVFSSESNSFYEQLEKSTGLRFESNGDGTCTLIGYGDCTDTRVVIPIYSPVGDLVTCIGETAFASRNNVIEVIMPDSITRIKKGAFYQTGLQSIAIPDSVVSIEDYAFRGCRSLTTVTLGCGITSIGNEAFNLCEKLSSISIPDSVLSIGVSAFASCYDLTTVYLGSGLDRISFSLFENCTSLTSVLIPDSITSIENLAFCNCSKLTSITIPASVTSIGRQSFEECSGLPFCTVGNEVYLGVGDNPYYLLVTTTDNKIRSCEIHEKTVLIGDNAFTGCKNLTSVNIPQDVIGIGKNAFSGCLELTSIIIPNSIKAICDYAFLGCGNLTSVSVGNHVSVIGKGAFQQCTRLAAISIPDSVSYIEEDAFKKCTSLSDLSMGQNVINIGGHAFEQCTELTFVSIPNRVEQIGDEAFRNCSKIISIKLGKNLSSIGQRVFYGCSDLMYISVAEGNSVYYSQGSCIIETETKALAVGCGNSIIPTDCSITRIGDYAFAGCFELDSITIPDGVTSIGKEAFFDCPKLTSVSISRDVKNIEFRAFNNCQSLSSIYYDGTRAEWNTMDKVLYWNFKTGEYMIYCSDGVLNKRGCSVVS